MTVVTECTEHVDVPAVGHLVEGVDPEHRAVLAVRGQHHPELAVSALHAPAHHQP